jgi:hypothetical protein
MITVRKQGLDFRDVHFVTREDMAAVGQLIRQRILERTARGVDAQGQPFQSYSASYAETKREALGSSGAVDLSVSGEMLRAMVVDVSSDAKTVSVRFAR